MLAEFGLLQKSTRSNREFCAGQDDLGMRILCRAKSDGEVVDDFNGITTRDRDRINAEASRSGLPMRKSRIARDESRQ